MSNEKLNFLQQISSKVGVGDIKIMEKALEYLRILQLKSDIRYSETHKAALCLDIAAAQLGARFDRNEAAKVAAVRSTVYNSSRSAIEKLLQIQNVRSIHEVCVQLGCEHISKLAEQILNKYKNADQIDRDFTHPQYVVAAVATACAIKKVPLNNGELVKLSNLKPRQWKQLKEEFMKFAEENGFKTESKTKKVKNDDKGLPNGIEKKVEKMEMEENAQKVQKKTVPAESYEEWRKRILSEAYAYTQKIQRVQE